MSVVEKMKLFEVKDDCPQPASKLATVVLLAISIFVGFPALAGALIVCGIVIILFTYVMQLIFMNNVPDFLLY